RREGGGCVGCWGAGGAGQGDRGAVQRRGRIRTRISESAGADGGAICAGPVRGEERRAAVPDRGPGEMAGGREPGVRREEGPAGEDPWIPDRVGRDRGGTAGACGGEAGGGGDARRPGGREASGGLRDQRRGEPGKEERREEWGWGAVAEIFEVAAAGIHGS